MTDNHPITPPPKLVQQWYDAARGPRCEQELATQAARWGADQELEACCEQLRRWGVEGTQNLRNTRRLGFPSLKEQALTQLDSLHADLKVHGLGTNTDTIRRALEQLDD